MALYDIADLVVQIDCEGDVLQSRAEAYKMSEDKTPDIIVERKENVIMESAEKYPHLTVADCEYMHMGSDFYAKLIDFDGMMLHASAVVVDGKAYLFSAHSGTGKSTHTSLWLKLFPNAYIINDDKPAIRMVDGEFYVYGTPFSGKHDLSRNTKAKLGGICFIERAEENSVHKMDMNDVIFNMLTQTLRRFPKERMDKMLTLLDKLLSNVGVYKLCCNMDISAAKLSYETMSGEKCNG
ncbi:MAG: hypothetical protein UHE86_08030 [Acutalibacteraceae bacterium]|nr:hypothetical protein [Acutalibacteraceae bacterium]